MKQIFLIGLTVLVAFSCKKKEDTPIPVEAIKWAKYGGGVYDVDSNFYKSVSIDYCGEWMASNLKTSHYRNGDTIFSGIDTNDITGIPSPKFFFYPNGDSINNLKKYGRLYTYHVVEDGRGLCPTGWHIPTKSEFDSLTKYTGGQETGGGKLKSTSYWLSPNTGADDESLFSALPAGFRQPQKVYNEVGKSGIWWTNTADTANRVWTYYLKYTYSTIFRAPKEKNFSYSVRCKRD
jgi:uncharacterized protein (TIGR02145 family)